MPGMSEGSLCTPRLLPRRAAKRRRPVCDLSSDEGSDWAPGVCSAPSGRARQARAASSACRAGAGRCAAQSRHTTPVPAAEEGDILPCCQIVGPSFLESATRVSAELHNVYGSLQSAQESAGHALDFFVGNAMMAAARAAPANCARGVMQGSSGGHARACAGTGGPLSGAPG